MPCLIMQRVKITTKKGDQLMPMAVAHLTLGGGKSNTMPKEKEWDSKIGIIK